MNKQQVLSKIEELKNFVKELDSQDEWVKIDYSIIPKETFDKYGAKPFEIMKKKYRENDKVVNSITWNDAKEKAKELGYRLPTIQEMLVLLDAYKKQYINNADPYHTEFLGIEELSYDEEVCYEWIDAPSPITRGGRCYNGSDAGAFTLTLGWDAGNTGSYVGFRCARNI
jgi:formylglycine-generating enzyme required for sulfatase activity